MSACADDTGGHVGALELLSYEVLGRVSGGRMDAAMSWMMSGEEREGAYGLQRRGLWRVVAGRRVWSRA